MFDAWHLPGLPDPSQWATSGPLRYPLLDAVALDRVTGALHAARPALARLSNEALIERIAAAAELLAPGTPLRTAAERWLPEAARWSPEMSALVIERMRRDWSREALDALLRAELPDPSALERFRPDASAPGRQVRLRGSPLAFHVFAGNVAGVGVTSLVRSLLARSAVLGKTGAGDPVLPVLFAHALARVDPALGDAVAVTYWPGGGEGLTARACSVAGTVVVYGGEDAVAAIRAEVPADTRLVVHGPRFSVGLIGRGALEASGGERLVGAVARATALFDQQGCVSPHVVYVERGGEITPAAFAERLAGALAALETELPRGPIDAEEAARVREARAAGEFRAGSVVHAPADLAWTVIQDEDARFEPSCLNRTVRVKAVDRLDEVVTRLAPFGPSLQSVALTGVEEGEEALVAALADIGATRMTTFDALPWPAPHLHHDGASPLGELLFRVDWERDAP